MVAECSIHINSQNLLQNGALSKTFFSIPFFTPPF